MKWVGVLGAAGAVAALAAARPLRDQAREFAGEVRSGMAEREGQLRETLAIDTGLTLPGERVDDSRALPAATAGRDDSQALTDRVLSDRAVDARAMSGP